MPYKRPINSSKKYMSPMYNSTPPYSMTTAESPAYQDRDFYGIPLPNEKEGFYGSIPESRKVLNTLSKIIRYVQKHVRVEELILVGLIILMLDESFEDDFLLIILIYILLF